MNLFQKLFFGKSKEPDYSPDSVTVRAEHDGTPDISDLGATALFSATGLGLAELPKNEKTAIEEYRRLAMTAEVDEAVQEIVNETFNIDQTYLAIKLSFAEQSKLSTSLQKKLDDVFFDVYHNLFDFDNQGAWLFKKFYVDGRLFIHKVIGKDQKRISSLRVIDTLQIRRLKNSHSDNNGLVDLSKEEIFYLYSPQQTNTNELWRTYSPIPDKILAFPDQAISYIDSGLVHWQDGYVVSHLSKAIVPFNNMKMMEDAMVIYRVIRSPSRRVFYVDVGDMPKAKGEQYLKDMMNQFKNRMTYDSRSGLIADRRNILSMLEDIWLPRKSNGRSTEVSTLEEGSNLGVTEDVEYCRDRFYRSLNVPRSRFNQEQNPFGLGRMTEITRDEYRFMKFIQSLRNRFIHVVEDVFRTELVLRGVIKDKEWKQLKKDFVWIFAEDNQFVQLKQSEILQNKLTTMQQVDSMVERYFSVEWALTNIMQFTESEIKDLKNQREQEQKDGTITDDNGVGDNTSDDDSKPEQPDTSDDEDNK